MRLISLYLLACFWLTPLAHASDTANNLDAVVAVVNSDVITRLELDEKLRSTIKQLKKQGTPLPDVQVLEKQLLERMIIDLLQLQYAKESGVRVDEGQLDLSINRIVEQNNLSGVTELRSKLEADGIDYDKFRDEMRNEMLYTRLRAC